ncbi:hypothetical protein Mapa_008837 [Marchantia paleacea]|nr:hypothetical protein Mapa_008837 [Marchantia paleacea]
MFHDIFTSVGGNCIWDWFHPSRLGSLSYYTLSLFFAWTLTLTRNNVKTLIGLYVLPDGRELRISMGWIGLGFKAEPPSIEEYRVYNQGLLLNPRVRQVVGMALYGAQSLCCRSISVWANASRCKTSCSSGSSCHVGPRISSSSVCILSFQRVRSVYVREVQTVRFNGSIAATRAVPLAEDVEFAEHKERVGKKGFELLGNKEKKELRAYAHSLGKDINVQQVGKLGITPTVITSISDALEANEIIKVKVLENCSSDQDEIIAQLEDSTGAQTVGKIGRTLLLYRASLKKLAATEKKAEKPKRRSRIAMSAGRYCEEQAFRSINAHRFFA